MISIRLLADTYVAKPEKLFINEDQERVDGWVLKPYNYDSNKKYPAILDIHGGPKVVYGETFFHGDGVGIRLFCILANPWQ